MTAGSDSRPISVSLLVLTNEIWRLPVAGFVAQPAKRKANAQARNAGAKETRARWDLQSMSSLQRGGHAHHFGRSGPALRQYDQISVGRRGREGEVGPPRRSHGRGGHGLRALVEIPAIRSQGS